MSNLKNIRSQRGLSQSKLAELSGVSLRMIQYYEQGANDINTAQAYTLYRLAKVLGCDMEDLLEGELAKAVDKEMLNRIRNLIKGDT